MLQIVVNSDGGGGGGRAVVVDYFSFKYSFNESITNELTLCNITCNISTKTFESIRLSYALSINDDFVHNLQ